MTSSLNRRPAVHDVRTDSTLVSRIEDFARTTPAAPAVRHGDRELIYAQLNQQANRLAQQLVGSGVARGDIVAMYLGRSIEWVVGMLGCLKAGAVCMPLDPAAPAERFSRAIEAARPVVVIGAGNGHPIPAGPDGLPRVLLDAGIPATDDVVDLPRPPRRAELAYAMFTSGSSGAAKIVLAQHSWIALSADRSAAINATTGADRGSWLGAAGAGIALHEVSGLLWRGAHIVIGERDVYANPRALQEWLLAQRITQCFVVAPVGEVLQSLPWPRDCALRLLTCGGERLHRWGPADLPFEVAVSYGCLEAFQVAHSCYPWERRHTAATATAADRELPPTVGRPIEGVTVHLLEEDGLTPVGDGIGEVWIDSDCLSLGYLGDPAQTADRFRPNPFGAAGSRIYRSGDAGRLRPDGILEHHGRIDDIVKIRGNRVELGDVEWALGLHSAVRRVAVVTAPDGDQVRLVACFVAERDVAPLELRNYALERLPDWMVPVAYVQLNALPQNTSNKIDRRQLPPADWARWRPASTWRAPAPGTETVLARLFSYVLRLNRVGADDHFVELGGDSLQLAELQGRIEQEFGRRIELADLQVAGTVSGLATLLDTAPQIGGLPPLHRVEQHSNITGIHTSTTLPGPTREAGMTTDTGTISEGLATAVPPAQRSGVASAPPPTLLIDLATGMWRTHTLTAAIETGLFEALAPSPATALELAGRLGINERPAEILLTACTALGLLEHQDGRYRNTAVAERYLVPGRPDYFGDYVQMVAKHTAPGWNRAAEAIRTDAPSRPVVDPSRTIFEQGNTPAYFWGALWAYSTLTARTLAEAVDLSGVRRIMDVGGGSGATLIELCRQHPHLSGTVLDLPHVCAIAQERIDTAGLSGRLGTTAANFFTDPLPTGHDAVLLSMIMHDWDEERNRKILAACLDALPSGGLVVISELLVDDDKTGPADAALMSMNMLVGCLGRNYTAAEYGAWLRDAGCVRVRTVRFDSPGANGVVIGEKA
ncbi:AMP-binding protein [Nocardia sp. NPDC006044]|uniref:AMP-binding protein n=1 Tax=Nocardia sp. NPDC006044 TaxID=3364306 RepID=UPI0036CDAB51